MLFVSWDIYMCHGRLVPDHFVEADVLWSCSILTFCWHSAILLIILEWHIVTKLCACPCVSTTYVYTHCKMFVSLHYTHMCDTCSCGICTRRIHTCHICPYHMSTFHFYITFTGTLKRMGRSGYRRISLQTGQSSSGLVYLVILILSRYAVELVLPGYCHRTTDCTITHSHPPVSFPPRWRLLLVE